MRDSLRGDAPSAYPREYDTLAGSQGALLGDPQGVEVKTLICPQVIAATRLDLWLGSGHPQGVPRNRAISQRPISGAPRRGAFFIARRSRHEVPKTPGFLRYALSIRPR